MRRGLVIAIVVALLAVLGAALIGGSRGGLVSTYSPRSQGLLAAYRYLEERGVPVERWQRPARELPLREELTLVLAAPWTTPMTAEDVDHLENLVRLGGRIVYLTAPDSVNGPGLLFDLRFGTLPVPGVDEPPWSYRAWRDWVRTPVVARATPRAKELGLPPRIAARRGRVSPTIVAGVERLYRDERGLTRVMRKPIGRGDVLVIDNAGVLSNALLAEPGNLELLEWLAAARGTGRLVFDEFVHGHHDPGARTRQGVGSIVALALHLGLVYLGIVWALSRRFGRPIVDEGPPRSSVARDLVALAELHRRAGHAGQAARAMAEAYRVVTGDDPPDGDPVRDERDLLDRARRLGELQQGERSADAARPGDADERTAP